MHPELIAFATRVLQRALEKGGHMPPHVYQPGELPPPDDQLVDGVAGQLLGFISQMDTTLATQLRSAGAVDSSFERERCQRLARALGACDCFGESLTCATCGGRGAP